MDEYRGITAIYDEQVLESIDSIAHENGFLLDALTDDDIIEEFITRYQSWLLDTKLNTIDGLHNFKYISPTLGTTQSFDAFYLKHSERRFCVFAGEYTYHKVALKQKQYHVLKDVSELCENDAFIISSPFSDYGNEHPLLEDALERCTELGIPALMDCAYFGACNDMHFNFNYSCIETVVFSLSKTFPVAHLRIGIRFNKNYDDDGIDILKQVDYTNRFGAAIGKRLMDMYTPDYIYEKYNRKQKDVCNRLNVSPSKCVLIGIGGENWFSLNRGNTWNRLCLSNELAKR